MCKVKNAIFVGKPIHRSGKYQRVGYLPCPLGWKKSVSAPVCITVNFLRIQESRESISDHFAKQQERGLLFADICVPLLAIRFHSIQDTTFHNGFRATS